MSILQTAVIWLRRHNLVPEGLHRFIQKHANMLDVRTASWIAKDPYRNDPPASFYEPKWPYTLGIIKEFWHRHSRYVAACRELGVAYKLLDISGPDWLEVVRQSGCDAFLVCPSVQVSIWKQMYDERLRVISRDLGKTLFPGPDEIWLYESKRRTHYWLEANGIPCPRTWVFYNLKQAQDFIEQTELPIVYKSDLGSGASGVRIFRDRRALRSHVKHCFRKGFTTYRRSPNDKEWGTVLLQEYLPAAREWRMVRIGDSFFGHEKGKVGDFHSGSHVMLYSAPPSDLLDFVREVTDRGHFRSMDLDIFMVKENRYLVNELQTFFGMDDPSESQCMVGGKSGRYMWEETTRQWCFDEGVFTQNFCCTLRVKTLLGLLGRRESAASGGCRAQAQPLDVGVRK